MTTLRPYIFRVAGPSNSGKTTWLLALLNRLQKQGVKVATIKHSHHTLEVLSRKDGHQLGSVAPNITVGCDRMLLDQPIDSPPNLFNLVKQFYSDMDVVLVEGWRSEDIPTLLIADPPTDWRVPKGIVARTKEVRSEVFVNLPVWGFEDVLDWVLQYR
jgi:molybdopterin-guanine dinucleotide biosynthesis protein MobB